MDFNSKYKSSEIEKILDSVGGKVDKISGKQLSTEDFTSTLKAKLEGLSNYDDTELSEALSTLRGDFDELVSGDTTTAIKTFNEVIAFLDGIQDSQDLSSIIASIEQQIAKKQDTLVSGTNIKTINGESILGEGDLTIESGAKVYEWFYDGESESVTLSQEEYDNIVEADLVVVNFGGILSSIVAKTGKEFSEEVGEYILTGQLDIQLIKVSIYIVIGISTKVATITTESQPEIPTNTSQLENDSNFVSSNDLKTINGQSIVGSGDIEISGGGVYITPFTVDEFFRTIIELTDEQRNELFNAAAQNRIIGIRFSHYDSSGYIIASYRNFSVDEELSSVDLSFVWKGAHYERRFYRDEDINVLTRLVTTSFLPVFYNVAMENGVALVFDDLSYTDNSVFLVDGECSELHVYLEPSEIGKTVRFITGESCTLEVGYSVYWANGEVPTIEPYTHYELSLVVNAEGAFNAVLTPFKSVE